MRLRPTRLFALSLLALLPCLTHAAPYYGGSFSYAMIAKEPPNLKGYQFLLNYDPQRFQWREFNVYFDGGFSHLWDTKTPYYSTVNVYAIAPVVRFNFKKRGPLQPYLDLSIGVAYLNHTHFENRNMGIHFAFQDRVGTGVVFGSKEQINVGIHIVHYSNARLSANNSGITIPLMLDVGYRFQ